MLTTVGELSALGSQLSLERGGAGTSLATGAGGTAGTEHLTSLWKGGLGQDVTGWLAHRGWQTQVRDLASVAASYGRPATADTRSAFVTATYHPSHR